VKYTRIFPPRGSLDLRRDTGGDGLAMAVSYHSGLDGLLYSAPRLTCRGGHYSGLQAGWIPLRHAAIRLRWILMREIWPTRI
jgi:hypothetical protein